MTDRKWTKRVDVAIAEDGSDWLPVSRITPGSPSISRRLGRFYFHLCSQGEKAGFGMTEIMIAMSQVAPIQVSLPQLGGHPYFDFIYSGHGFNEFTYEVIGFSEHFRELADGEKVPEYVVVFHSENGYIVWFEFQEV